ncbi:hypothetical protein ABMA28_016080 [Loxostege sticticalis]|uniref:NlpC/P60 domain-containing protein n=1 Tax=Loxostege sticticalis TaxID=481309 RepID=A0ABD0T7J8_LOXSC
MKTLGLVLFSFLFTINIVCCFKVNTTELTNRIYTISVDLGIICPDKYSQDDFERDEKTVFRDLYNEYVSLNYIVPINYDEWIVMNNFGILADKQESLFEKITKRSTADNKRRFMNTVRMGDILITGRGIGGLVGHAAIMTTDNIVLEMPGGFFFCKYVSFLQFVR